MATQLRTSRTLMTTEQKKAFHAMLKALGYEAIDKPKAVEYFTGGRYYHCSDMDYVDAQTMLRKMRELLNKGQRTNKKEGLSEYQQHMDKLRKGCIKAVFVWFERQNKTVTMDYVKAVICRAAGRDKLNDLSEGELTRIYNEFCRKQAAQVAHESQDFTINMN